MALELSNQDSTTSGDEGNSTSRVLSENRWRHLWKLKILKKILHFVWKSLHEILPTKPKLFQKKVVEESSCPICGMEAETVLHLFCTCSLVQLVWSLFPFNTGLVGANYNSFVDLCDAFEAHWQNVSNKDGRFSLIAVGMWYMWKNRNGAVFEHKILLPQVVSSRAAGCLDEYLAANRVVGEALGAREEVSSVAWQRPSTGFVKINVDGGWVKSFGKGAYGVVIRDANGMFISTAAGCLSWCGSSEIAEAMAVLHSVQMGLQLGLNAMMVESDSQSVIKMINGNYVVSQSVSSIIHDVKVLSNDFQSCMFLFARRSSNSVAHTLASKGIGGLDCSLWTESPPVWLLDPLSRDEDSS